MKKNFVQKLALGLALVMTVTSVPATSKAAVKPAFKTSSVTVTEGETVKAVIKNTKGWTAKKIVVKDGTVAEATAVQKKKKVNVKVTGVKAGETKVVTKLTKGGKVVKAKLNVTVEAAKIVGTTITEAKAIATDAITLAVLSEKTDFTKEEVKVYNTKTKVREAVKSVKVAEDGTVVVTLYNEMVDGNTYTVSLANSEVVEFGITIGTINSIVVEDKTVLPIYNKNTAVKNNDPAKIVYHVYDENGLEVTRKYPVAAGMIFESLAYIDQAKGEIYLYHEGDAAKVKVVYNYYDKVAGKIVPIVSNEATYVAADSQIVSVGRWYIDNLNTKGTVEKDQWIAVGDTGRDLEVFLVNDRGVEIPATDFQTTDPTILFVGKDGLLEARKAGTVEVIAQNGIYKHYITVEVKPARVFSGITTKTPAVTLSNHIVWDDKNDADTNNDRFTGETTTINFYAVDQYGVKMEKETNGITVKPVDTNKVLNSIATVLDKEGNVVNAAVKVTAETNKVGAAYFQATYNGQTAFANVSVVTPGGHAAYVVDSTDLTANKTFDTSSALDRSFSFKVFSVDANGVRRQIITNANHDDNDSTLGAHYWVVNSKNEVVTTSGTAIVLPVNETVLPVSGAAVITDLSLKATTALVGDETTTNTVDIASADTSLANGSYSLVVQVNTAKVVVPFTIASTRVIPSVSAIAKNIEASTTDKLAVELAKNLVTNTGATIEGVVITSYDTNVIDVDGNIKDAGKTVPVLVKKVVVKDKDNFYHVVTVGEVSNEGIVINVTTK